MSLKKRVIDLLNAIPDISELPVNPSLFSDNIDLHDCDVCPASSFNQGDTYDDAVCVDCWERVIDEAFCKNKLVENIWSENDNEL